MGTLAHFRVPLESLFPLPPRSALYLTDPPFEPLYQKFVKLGKKLPLLWGILPPLVPQEKIFFFLLRLPNASGRNLFSTTLFISFPFWSEFCHSLRVPF